MGRRIKIEQTPNSVCKISGQAFNVLEINSIAKRYKPWRQESKAPTFALTR